jgi:peptidyl-prolyl cis-trans isomerase SurA
MPTLRRIDGLGSPRLGFAAGLGLLLALLAPTMADPALAATPVLTSQGHAATGKTGSARTGTASPKATDAAEKPLIGGSRIAAVVNGDVISEADIVDRAKLFAISTGLPVSPEVIEHLRSQILRELIDERLRVQEAQRRKIIIQDSEIAAAIKDIEARNNMQPGALRAKFAAIGVSPTALIDQIRAQLAWTALLRATIGSRMNITPAEVAEQEKLAAQSVGKTEYRLGEIFIPAENPANISDAKRFAETVISELRAGAAFPLVAAQFSQNQSALQGGEIGWQQANELDPAVARVVSEMPVGAISNPIRVPGGFSVVTLQAKREIGHDIATIVTLRQAFFPFTVPLTDPQNPTEQQRQALLKARNASATIHSCDQMEAFAKATNPPDKPTSPGDVRVEGVNPPAFRQLLQTIPIGKATEPLISRDGIAVITVCSRDQKNVGEITAAEIQRRLLNERVEMLSRQTMRDLHRKATIDIRGNGV